MKMDSITRLNLKVYPLPLSSPSPGYFLKWQIFWILTWSFLNVQVTFLQNLLYIFNDQTPFFYKNSYPQQLKQPWWRHPSFVLSLSSLCAAGRGFTYIGIQEHRERNLFQRQLSTLVWSYIFFTYCCSNGKVRTVCAVGMTWKKIDI